MNTVKLYTSGTALVSRVYPLNKGETKISIPVKKGDLDEVVASLSVMGDVKVPEPPSYTPVNAKATSLVISPCSALKDTVTKLAGSDVQLVKSNSTTLRGKLVGVHTYEETNANGMTSERLKVVLLTDEGLTLAHESDIAYLRFTDEGTQAEYLKALAQSYQTIKPDSSFVDLTVLPQNESSKNVMVTYATPVAAWKPRYQLRFSGSTAEFEGVGIVDNDTEDNWKDSVLSLIVGDPIAFETDAAEIRRPARTRVNIVNNTAQGAVNVSETKGFGFPRSSSISPAVRINPAPAMAMLSQSRGMEAAGGGYPSDDAVSLQQLASGDSYAGSRADFDDEEVESFSPAQQDQADVKESGDFAVFTTTSGVNIGSKKSALVPLFRTNLTEAKTVLFYKKETNPTRAFRAIKFKNETKHSLGKGTCEIYLDGDFQGKSVLANNGALSPGAEDFLVHAKENGVKFFHEVTPRENRRVSFKMKDSVAYIETAARTVTTYTVTNNKDQPFDVVVEHVKALDKSECTVSDNVVVQETASGWRLSFTLNAKESMQVVVTENAVYSHGYSLNETNGPNWLNQNVVLVKNPLARNKHLQELFALQEKLDEVNTQVKTTENRIKAVGQEQTRLKDVLIPNVHGDQANRYRTEMAELEDEHRLLTRTTLPQLQKEQRDMLKTVRNALHELNLKWSEKEAQ